MTDHQETEYFRDPSGTDSTDAPAAAAAVPERSGCGCLVIKVLLVLTTLLIALMAIVYYIVMHSSWPLRSLAGVIEELGKPVNLRVAGVSGSISSGIEIKSLTWNDGQVEGVKIDYNGILDLYFHQQLILREVHIRKAHLNLSDVLFHPSDRQSPNGPAEGQPNHSGESPLKRFRIDRLSLQDIELKNDSTGFLLSIPLLEWKGFNAEGGKIEFGNISVDSDRLKIETKPPTTEKYQRRLEAVILPKLHHLILQPINLAIEFGYAKGKLAYKFTAFDGKLDVETTTEPHTRAQCQKLNLGEYFDLTLPQELTFEAVVTEDPDTKVPPLETRSGSFKLGQRKFVIVPRPFERFNADRPDRFTLATSSEGDAEIDYELEFYGNGTEVPRIVQRLTTKPPTDQREILARVFYGKGVTDLNESEQKEIDKKRASFGSPQGIEKTAEPEAE